VTARPAAGERIRHLALVEAIRGTTDLPEPAELDAPRRWTEPANGILIKGILIMGVLMVKCPACGREFSTGIQIEEDSLAKLPDAPVRACCPACKTEHSWSPSEARHVDAIPASQWVEALDPPS
jgi:hypothetical protein